jgi:adenylate kinase
VAAASPRTAAAVVRVVFLGPPGAGKGTQAAKLAAWLGIPRISTGDMLRDAITQGTPVGREAEPMMGHGNLVPDHLLIALVRDRIARPDCERGFILDGFPRTLAQARGLEEMTDGGPGRLVVFDFEVPRDEILRRLSGRRWCPRCQATYHVLSSPPRREGVCDNDGTSLVQREDDKEAVVKSRLFAYDQQTAPLIGYYDEQGVLVRIDGYRAKETVFSEMRDAVEGRS